MPITSVTKDPEKLTLTVVADFPVPQKRLWDAWADPRQLERPRHLAQRAFIRHNARWTAFWVQRRQPGANARCSERGNAPATAQCAQKRLFLPR
jgi:uncharacterized protein YndB with AHSA1/START domain